MEWIKGKLIGRGSSADVSMGRSHSTGEVFAVKCTPLSRSSVLKKEVEIHSTLKCTHIIEYKGNDVTLENGHFFYNVYLEYASGGTIIDVVRKKGGSLSEPRIRQYAKEIVQGLEYLHCKGLVHCDIKGANILVTDDGVKIGDFGCSKRVNRVTGFHSSPEEIVGTPMYMAPEVARGEQQSYPADVWALGCTVLEMATGLPPWPNISQEPISALYWIGFTGTLPEIPRVLSVQAKDFLAKCLKADPNERWSAAQLLKHPFLNDVGLFHEFKLDTPTSVLDPSHWENIEKSNPFQEIVAHERSLKSLNERIRELARDSSSDLFTSSIDDDDWITVRSKGTDQTGKHLTGLCRTICPSSKPDLTSEPSPATEILSGYKEKNCIQCRKSFSNNETIESFAYKCQCMQTYSSVDFSASKSFLENLFDYLRIICILDSRSNTAATKLSLVTTKKVCNILLHISIVINNFRICTTTVTPMSLKAPVNSGVRGSDVRNLTLVLIPQRDCFQMTQDENCVKNFIE